LQFCIIVPLAAFLTEVGGFSGLPPGAQAEVEACFALASNTILTSGVKRKLEKSDVLLPTESIAKKARTLHVASAPAASWCGAGQVVLFAGIKNAALESAVWSAGGRVAKSVVKKLSLVVKADARTSNKHVVEALSKGIPMMTVHEFASAANVGRNGVQLPPMTPSNMPYVIDDETEGSDDESEEMSMPAPSTTRKPSGTATVPISSVLAGVESNKPRPVLFFDGFWNAQLELAAQLAGIIVAKSFSKAVTMVVVSDHFLRASKAILDIDKTIPVVNRSVLLKALQNGLIWAASHGNSTLVPLLLATGSSVDFAGRGGETALIAAAKRGRNDIVLMLLDAGANTEAKNIHDHTALIAAAHAGHNLVASTLVAAGANVDASKGWTALMWAVNRNNSSLVAILLAAGANTEILDSGGNTTIALAASRGHSSIVCMLLDAGANIDAVTNDSCTHLMMAARAGHTSIVSLLHSAGASMVAVDKYGHTALQCAADRAYVSTVSVLLAGGALW
jgi:ankyrin repeat protein